MGHGRTRMPSLKADRHSCFHLGTEVKPKSLSRAVRPKAVGRRPPVPRWRQLCLEQFALVSVLIRVDPCFPCPRNVLRPAPRARLQSSPVDNPDEAFSVAFHFFRGYDLPEHRCAVEIQAYRR